MADQASQTFVPHCFAVTSALPWQAVPVPAEIQGEAGLGNEDSQTVCTFLFLSQSVITAQAFVDVGQPAQGSQESNCFSVWLTACKAWQEVLSQILAEMQWQSASRRCRLDVLCRQPGCFRSLALEPG